MARTQTTINQMFAILVATSEEYGDEWFYIDDAKKALKNLPEGMDIKHKDISNRLGNMVADGLLERTVEPSGRSFNKYHITDDGFRFIKRERAKQRHELEQQKLTQPQPATGYDKQEKGFSINIILSKNMMEGIIEAYNNGNSKINLQLEDKQ